MEPTHPTSILLHFISKETAELAEQKGFNEPSGGDYWAFGDPKAEPDFYEATAHPSPYELAEEYEDYHPFLVLRVPYQAHLQMWLRVRHNIHVNLTTGLGGETVLTLVHPGDKRLAGSYASYEQALEAGLRLALETIHFSMKIDLQTYTFASITEAFDVILDMTKTPIAPFQYFTEKIDTQEPFLGIVTTTYLQPFKI